MTESLELCRPEVGRVYLYKERGGCNWCLCKLIARYEGKVWLHNFHTGSMPVSDEFKYQFKKAKLDQ